MRVSIAHQEEHAWARIRIEVRTVIPEADVMVPVERQDQGDVVIANRRFMSLDDWPKKLEHLPSLSRLLQHEQDHVAMIERYCRGTATPEDVSNLAKQSVTPEHHTLIEHQVTANDQIHELMMRAYAAGFVDGEPSAGLHPDPESDDSRALDRVKAIRKAYPESPA